SNPFPPPQTQKTNPTGHILFAFGAGIERKVKFSGVRSDGTVVSTATSHLLGATGRITVGGKSYYGAELQLPAPVGGAYTIRAEILASDGSTVQTDEYPLTVDVTPPTYSSLAPVYSNYGQVTVSSNHLLAPETGRNTVCGFPPTKKRQNSTYSRIAMRMLSKKKKKIIP
ncbi:DUF4165 domain-containing protein, partial [Salmonella enterica]|uniref:DUF4165 domain-containing protein n=1 Tax=Salmonella enterica TaxID=28901 RepID=UPI002159DA98